MENNIGHNNPPGMIDAANETAKDISAWMAEMPVIETEEAAREAKLFLDRGKLCIKDLEDERDGKVRPLNEQVESINSSYRPARQVLSSMVALLGTRLTEFITAERKRRDEIAAQAHLAAKEAEERAREADRIRRDSIESAGGGELGIDLVSSVAATEEAIKDFEYLARKAALAQREAHVKIGGGFSRAISLRTKETLIVQDPVAAMNAIGLTDDIREAIIKSARAYRKLRGKLPVGVTAEHKEEI